MLRFFTLSTLVWAAVAVVAVAQPRLGPYTIGARLAVLQPNVVADETPQNIRASGIKMLRLKVPPEGITWNGLVFTGAVAVVEFDTVAAIALERTTANPVADLDSMPATVRQQVTLEGRTFRETVEHEHWAYLLEGNPRFNLEVDTDPTAELMGEDSASASSSDEDVSENGSFKVLIQTRERNLLNQSVTLDCANVRFNPASVYGVWRVETINTELADFERFAQFSFEPTGVVQYTSANRAVRHTFRTKFTGSAMRLVAHTSDLVLDFCVSYQGAKLVLEANFGAERYVLIR